MRENPAKFQAIAESEIDPRIAAVLDPGERVYWQAEHERTGQLANVIFFLIAAGLVVWLVDLREVLDNVQRLWEQLPWVFALFALVPVALVAKFFWNPDELYALTDQRVMLIRRGRIVLQARPEQLMLFEDKALKIGGSADTGDVKWANADTYDQDDRRNYVRFLNIQDPKEVTRMLEDWRQEWLDTTARQAEATSAAFRRPASEHGGDATQADGIQRIVNPQYGFSIDVPADWEVEVAQNRDGPLRVLGLTLIKRVIRPGKSRSWDPRDTKAWNRMTLSGGPSVGLNLDVHSSTGETMPTEQEVLDDRWGPSLGVTGKFLERDLDVNGLRGFAAVRELPAGINAMGSGELPAGVISRQVWLSGHGLDFELNAIAPQDSATLQNTLDLVVNSLRPTGRGAARPG
jgi:hypothetical protein